MEVKYEQNTVRRSRKMNVKERVLASRLVEKSEQNRKTAEQMGLHCKLSRLQQETVKNPKPNHVGV